MGRAHQSGLRPPPLAFKEALAITNQELGSILGMSLRRLPGWIPPSRTLIRQR
jgi:hypothetical protein